MLLYDIEFNENNINEFREIILNHKSCVKEDVFKKYFPKIYEYILTLEFPDNFTFKQKLFHYIYEDVKLEIGKCKQCGNRTRFLGVKNGYRTYCNFTCMGKCKEFWDKHKETNLRLYNTEYPSQCNKVKEKIKETNLKKYGTTCTFQNEQVKEKIKETNLKKYGVEFYNNPQKIKKTYQNKTDEEIKRIVKKREETYEKRTGYRNPFSNPDVIESINLKNFKNYGCVCPSQNNEIKEKISKTKLSFSDEYIEEINKKREETCFNLYGVKHISQCDDIKQKISESKIQNTINKYDFVIDTDGYSKFICTCTDCNCNKCLEKQFTIYRSLYFKRLKNNEELCIIKNPIKQSSHSKEEKEFINYIKNIYTGKIITNDRNVLNGKEIDVYIPELNIGFEYNGLYFHSEYYKSKEYHQEKSLLSKSKGVNLIQIWEDDWFYKPDVIKHVIKTYLNIIENEVNSKDCIVKEISQIDSINFINKNNIDNYINSDIHLGLFYKDELIEIITFNKNQNDYNIIQHCVKNNFKIIGEMKEILSFMIDTYNPHVIHVTSSLDISKNTIYEDCGFIYKNILPVNFTWVNSSTDNLKKYNYPKHRFNPNKLKEYNEEELYDMNYYKCYDSGYVLYELKI